MSLWELDLKAAEILLAHYERMVDGLNKGYEAGTTGPRTVAEAILAWKLQAIEVERVKLRKP